MPKLKTMTFRADAQTGDKLEFKSDLSVDSEGVFSATIPEEVFDSLRTIRGRGEFADVDVGQPRRYYRASAPTLDVLKKAIKAAMDEHLAVEVITDRVIVYGYTTDVNAYEDGDGTLHANGYIGDDVVGRWHPMGRNMSPHNPASHFQVGLAAAVMDKITYRRQRSERVEYKRPVWEHSHLEFPTYASKLNAFVGIRLRRPEAMSQMPYTEEAAKFFYDAMIGLCMLGKRIHEFFGDEEQVQLAIAGSANLLPVLDGPKEPED